MNPELKSVPMFSAFIFWSAEALRAVRRESRSQRIRPPTKMAEVDSKGRYIPTATSMGDGALMRIRPRARNIPTMTSGQAISPPTMPLAMRAMSPAWGAESCSEPIL